MIKRLCTWVFELHRIASGLSIVNRRFLMLITDTLCTGRAARLGLAALLIGVGWLVACGDAEPSQPQSDGGIWDVVQVDSEARWLPILATQDLAVGVKRIAFSLDGLDAAETPPTVRVSLFALDEDAGAPRSVQFARFIPYDPQITIAAHGHANATVSDRALPIGRGVYVVPVQLSAAGLWGVLLEMQASDDGAAEVARIRFSVRERQAAPAVGDRAPAVRSRTRDDVGGLRELTSDPEPEPGLYTRSIDDALETGSPLLIAFATPAFCHSRTCAPVLDAVKTVWRDYAPALQAIHVEVFENPHEPERLVETQAFIDWRLPSEPWVFVIDRAGVIRYAYEGAVTEVELRSAVDWVIQDGE